MNPACHLNRLATLALFVLAAGSVAARPFVNNQFQGRIAYSSDGNHNDPDDWAASPLALAIFAEAGLRDRLVHFDYNSILPLTEPDWENYHAASVSGAVERYGYDRSRFFDCRRDLDGAIASTVRAINDSSAGNPLYFIIAGPMEVPFRALQKADPEKLRYVYCISHSRWNDGFEPRYKFRFTKRDIIERGVHWVQIPDQNRRLSFGRFGSPARPAEFSPYFWMRDARDEKIRFLWECMVVSTRPDPSDAGMAWFLATGDEECDPQKLERLLIRREAPSRTTLRQRVRLEAENFRHVTGFVVEDRGDRGASHRLNLRKNGPGRAQIRTPFDEPYARPAGRYDVEIRYLDAAGAGPCFAFFVNGEACGAAWTAAGTGQGWTSHVIRDVEIKFGDELRLDVEGADGRIDFVQLNSPGMAATAAAPAAPATSGNADVAAKPRAPSIPKLDDGRAMPGGLIVAGANPGHLKYNGGGVVFLSGPDNPEDFLFLGTENPDGTRSGGGQSEIIARLAKAGVNAFHCLAFRMKRCNYKNEGDDTHSPFIGHDPSKPLNEAVMAQWDGWLNELEDAGINLHFEIYNDATDVEMLGWKLDAAGNLHPDEERFITALVRRFKHHKNILWGIEESGNKLPRARTAHFKKIGEVIARADNYRHPIVASFVVPNDPEGDFPNGGATTDDYAGDPHIRVITWLHLVPHGKDYEKQHQEYLRYARMDRHRFVAMKNETFRHPRDGEASRRYMWACAMTGLHTLEAYHHAGGSRPASDATLRDDARIREFMERTDFYRLHSDDELAAAGTRWVLAAPGESYIAYSYDCAATLGLKHVPPGTYSLLWFDTVSGRFVEESVNVGVAGQAAWPKPAGFGPEVALYVRRTAAR